MALVVVMMAGPVFAGSATLPSTVYLPGRYLPLRLEAEAAGIVKVSGLGILPIEWHAAGRSSAVVPLLVLRADRPIFVNGQFQNLGLQPFADGDADPPELTAFWQQVDPNPGGTAEMDSAAESLARLWQPGITDRQRQWVLTMLAVSVLLLAVARHAWPKHALIMVAVTAAGLSAAAFWLYPADFSRRTLPAEGRPGWEWVWFAGGPGEVREPWVAGLRYVWHGPLDERYRRPTLHCDAAGRPTEISVHLNQNARALLLRPKQIQ